mmetsp:Transcript_39059/g.62592  ORF Transcript_39059/g.62592 Transcript_39059/m.62592 type:complete len:98 (-) Transcript_39059:115-408(-)
MDAMCRDASSSVEIGEAGIQTKRPLRNLTSRSSRIIQKWTLESVKQAVSSKRHHYQHHHLEPTRETAKKLKLSCRAEANYFSEPDLERRLHDIHVLV